MGGVEVRPLRLQLHTVVVRVARPVIIEAHGGQHAGSMTKLLRQRVPLAIHPVSFGM